MIQDRIIEYLEYKGISKYKFYKETGLSNGFLDKKGTIGADKCEIIYSHYPDLNLEWLITGQGEKLKENAKSEDFTDLENLFKKIISKQQKIIEKLEEKK
jgi:hypothetical protein